MRRRTSALRSRRSTSWDNLEGVHLIGDADVEDGKITLNVWVDEPIYDLMGADQLAYDIFGRLSEEIFYAERCSMRRESGIRS